jgi:hypothetical protein
MNYIFYLKKQVKFYILLVLGAIIGYPIGCYFGWREALIFSPEYILIIVSGTLTFVFLGPLIQLWLTSNK